MIRTLLLVLAVALVGCTAPETPSAADIEVFETPPLIPVGMALRIPELGIDEPLLELRRDGAGVLEPPPVTEPEKVGWYAEGVLPGQAGPALIAGHVSGRPPDSDHSVPGVFARLHELGEGDQVVIVRGSDQLAFEVYQTGSYRKDEFPHYLVYGDTESPELRLVTCTGFFDSAAHSYDENLVVFARLVA